MNYEFIKNAVKAGQYGRAAMQSLVPEESREHIKNIRREMKALIISALREPEDCFSETSKESSDRKESSESNECSAQFTSKKSYSSVKKVTIN